MSQTVEPFAPAIRSRWGVPRFGYYSNVAMLWIGTRFLLLGYVLVGFAAIYFFVFVPCARRASIQYLDLIHAKKKRSFFRRCRQTYRHMVEFGLLLLDRALMLARPNHGFTVTCQGLDHLAQASRELSAEGRPLGTILLSAHFGNAESVAPYIRKMGDHRSIHIVMYQEKDQGTERFHTRHRAMLAEMQIISTTDSLAAGTRIMRALKQGDVVAMRADRTLSGKGVPVTLLGCPVELPAGPFLAAVLSGTPVVSVYTCRLGYRRYACRISRMRRYGEDQPGTRDERLARAAADYAEFLESMVRAFPYQWSNFYDYWQVQRPKKEPEP